MELPALAAESGMERVRSDASAGGVPRGTTQQRGCVAKRKKAGMDVKFSAEAENETE